MRSSRPAADDVGRERGDHLDGDHLRRSRTEEQREGERCGERLLADLAVDLDREQLAEQDERGEHPELGVERGRGRRRRASASADEYGDARGAYEPQVEGEGGWWSQALGRVAAKRRVAPGPGPTRSPLSRAAQTYGRERLQLTGRSERLKQDKQTCEGDRGAVGLRLEGQRVRRSFEGIMPPRLVGGGAGGSTGIVAPSIGRAWRDLQARARRVDIWSTDVRPRCGRAGKAGPPVAET